jgi:hypothetical protein
MVTKRTISWPDQFQSYEMSFEVPNYIECPNTGDIWKPDIFVSGLQIKDILFLIQFSND